MKKYYLSNLQNIGITVVIVTYNGSQRIKPVLKHLSVQEGISFDWEVIIVDNNSNDNTSTKAYQYWQSLKKPFKLKILQEHMPGTMYARKKGIVAANYRYLLFCDDDNWLSSKYISRAFELIHSDSQIAAVGGIGLMHYERNFEIPNWIKPYEKNYGTGPQGQGDGETTYHKECLYSAGTVFDRVWIAKLYESGFQSSLKGRDNKSLRAGEDTELTYALKTIGAKLWYSSSMKFHHFMPASRINWKYLKKLWRAFGYGNYVLSPYNNHFSSKKAIGTLQILINLSTGIFVSYLRIFKYKLKDGDIEVLKLEKQKGELKAVITANNRYKQNKKMVQILKKFRENENSTLEKNKIIR